MNRSPVVLITGIGRATRHQVLDLTRFVAGAGIGGEYTAINSVIDEMIPARYRERVDMGVNGTYWAGSIIGTLVSLAFLNWIGRFWAGGSVSWSARHWQWSFGAQPGRIGRATWPAGTSCLEGVGPQGRGETEHTSAF
jgi:MFS family permease